MFKRIFLIVLDSVGIGEATDALNFNDVGANTLGHIIEKTNVNLPNLEAMGLLNLINKSLVSTNSYYGKLLPISNGKDTLTGHLEMMGIQTSKPFKTFLNGFPSDLINELEIKTGRKVIGNCVASGTEIIESLGEIHMKTGAIIVYTSADSVLQIAAHEDIIKLEELNNICKIAREITLKDEWKVGRIIARPFTGVVGNFIRTPNRHDYALDPVKDTVLDELKNNNYDVISIGKIADIFNNCGITKNIKIKDNLDGINSIINIAKSDFNGLCFANLNDFDSKYGHRRNVSGYASALAEFDLKLPEIMVNINENDLLLITADHGNDPTYRGTDHTRENTFILCYSPLLSNNSYLGELESFGSIGATIAANFNLTKPTIGVNFLGNLK